MPPEMFKQLLHKLKSLDNKIAATESFAEKLALNMERKNIQDMIKGVKPAPEAS
jgi:hypothetical protein